MGNWGFIETMFLAAMIAGVSLVGALGYQAGAGEAGQMGARIIAGFGLVGAAGVMIWAIFGPVVGALIKFFIERAEAKKAAIEERAFQLMAEVQETEISRQMAPHELAKLSESDVLSKAVTSLNASHSAWRDVMDIHPNLEQRKFAHAMRTVQEACQATMRDPILMKSDAAHERLAATMTALSHEMLDDLREVEQGRLQDLSINLSTLERQVSLAVVTRDEVRT